MIRAYVILAAVTATPLSANDKQSSDPAKDDPLGYWAERLPSPDDKVRLHAVCELGKLGANAAPAVPAIADRLHHDKDAMIRKAAAGALGQIGPGAKSAVPTLILALKDEGHEVASWSATALGAIGPDARAAVPALTKLLSSNVSTPAYTSAVSLGRIGPDAKAAVPELLRFVAENPHGYRAYAAEALWRIEKHKEVIPALMRMMKDPERDDIGSAAEVLGRIGPDAKAAIPLLEHALRDQRSLVAVKAALALWQIEKHKDAIPALIEQLSNHPSLTERSHAAQRLAMIGPEAKEAIPALVKALRDDQRYVAPCAADALKKIDPAAAKRAGVE